LLHPRRAVTAAYCPLGVAIPRQICGLCPDSPVLGNAFGMEGASAVLPCP